MIDSIFTFLSEIDLDFPTPLSQRIDLKDYSKKLVSYATIFKISHDDEIIGMVALYCNNVEDRYAYIPLLGVLKDFRGLGISSMLMKLAINYAKKLGFRKLGVHTENDIALKTYLSLGFQVIENQHRKYLELAI